MSSFCPIAVIGASCKDPMTHRVYPDYASFLCAYSYNGGVFERYYTREEMMQHLGVGFHMTLINLIVHDFRAGPYILPYR